MAKAHRFLRSSLASLVILSPSAGLLIAQSGTVQVAAFPETIYIEEVKDLQQSLQFDFSIHNTSNSSALLVRLDLQIFDSQGKLVRQHFVDRGGTAPGLEAYIKGPFQAGAKAHIFNPFDDFDSEVELARLEYLFTFTMQGQRSQRISVVVEPQRLDLDFALYLPMRGPLLVRDGHDFISHHRRVDLLLPALQGSGLVANSNRYAYDFVKIDAKGREKRGNGSSYEDWYIWAAKVFAPAAGKVVDLETDFPDNLLSTSGFGIYNPRVTPQSIRSMAGNFVALEHGPGIYSFLGHLRMGSIEVAIGDEVNPGDLLGEVGLSGASGHPHLHFHMQDGISMASSEGLPGPFSNYRRLLGSRSLEVEIGQVDGGDIVEALPLKKAGSR